MTEKLRYNSIMSARLYKILLILGMAACAAAVLLFWLAYRAPNRLVVDFLDAGQGDAILIKAPSGQNILIDGGPDKSAVKRLGENLPWWDKRIDLMILTHPHDDHVTGLIDVLKRYSVGKILYTGVTHTAPNYLTWLKLVRDSKTPMIIIDKTQTIKLGQGCELEILYPAKSFLGQTIEDLNQSSIIARLSYGQTKFLLTGDAGEEVETELLNRGADISADVLKVGHHGSQYSTGQEFLNKVRPKIAVIEAGKDNQFGHPNLRTIKKLERVGARIYRTDKDGTIEIISDGVSVIASPDAFGRGETIPQTINFYPN
ncbi:MAG: ComEC/Rec2 family competence protein [bacterium]|nr:ComEC/Rec2 family competence protein [bacterium]